MIRRLFYMVFILAFLLAGCAGSTESTRQPVVSEQPDETLGEQDAEPTTTEKSTDAAPTALPVASDLATPEPSASASVAPLPTTSASATPTVQCEYTHYTDYSYTDLFEYLPDNFMHLYPIKTVSIGHRDQELYIRTIYAIDEFTTSDFEQFLENVQEEEDIQQKEWDGEGGEIITESTLYTLYPYWEGGYLIQVISEQELDDTTKHIYFPSELFNFEGLSLPDVIRDEPSDEEALFLFNPDTLGANESQPYVRTVTIWINLSEKVTNQVVDHYTELLSGYELFKSEINDEDLVSISALLDEYKMIYIYARPPHEDYTGYQLQIIVNHYFEPYEIATDESE